MRIPGFSFSVIKRHPVFRARAGVLETPHGRVETPTFLPVGTQGTVKALTPEDLHHCGAQMILANTYHLYLRPGDGLIRSIGGLHQFMRWNGPLLTDSGGYQVSSLGLFRDEGGPHLVKIEEDGVVFRSHIDGSRHRITPEKAMDIQENLGADIVMAFDEATPNQGKRYAREAMERTHRWLVRCTARWEEWERKKHGRKPPQALFGIIQGGNYRDLRRSSAEFVVGRALPGIAVGGESIGKSAAETAENVSWIADVLPPDVPLYLMGVGVTPGDVVAAVMVGADVFDCVAPTRLARMGHLYSGALRIAARSWEFVSEFPKGRLTISQARFREDQRPVSPDCDCLTCRTGFSRAYLHHLFRAKELLFYRLASIHNLRFFIRITARLREAILG